MSLDIRDAHKRITQYAVEHYTVDGWDYYVECWDEQELQAFVEQMRRDGREVKTYEQLFHCVSDTLQLIDQVRSDIQGQ